jgi:hypothetical protein
MAKENLVAPSEQEVSEAEKKKGIQSITVYASVDPTAYVQFKVREDLVKHFGIKPVSDSIGEEDKLFVPKRTKVATSGKTVVTASSSTAGSVQGRTSKIIGRAIKVPTGSGYERKVGASLKSIALVTLRVPSLMSLPAIILWINSAFATAGKRPKYFITSAGARVSINSDFSGTASKAKLANKKNE